MIGRKALGKATALPQPIRDVYVWVNRNIGRLDPSPRVLPNFYVAGTQRGGTTSLFIYLLAHELVHGPRRAKGVHYFDTNFERSVRWFRGNFPRVSTIDAQRAAHGVEPAVGEGAPYYLFNPLIPARIHALSPDARIITVLREPLERAISHHSHEVSRGFETLSVDDAFRAEGVRLAGEVERMTDDPTYVSKAHIHHAYLSRGMYAEQLERYIDLFGRDRVLVLDSDALKSHPESTVRSATEFLGLPPMSGVDYPLYNQRVHDPVSTDTRLSWGQVFDESNARLRELLDPGTLSWL
jgi:hypothetical protein